MITKAEYIKKWKEMIDFFLELLMEPAFEIILVFLMIVTFLMWRSVP